MKSIVTNLQVGSIVRSQQGHDEDRLYVVTQMDGEFAYVVDGDYRPLSKPKRKRLKHLTKAFPQGIDEETLGDMHDFEIKKYLKTLQKS